MKSKKSLTHLLCRVALAGLLFSGSPRAAFAVADTPWSFFLAGAYPFSVGPTHHWTNGEFGITGGFGYQDATWPVGLQFEGMTYRFGFNDNATTFADSDGFMQMTAGTANVTWTPESMRQNALKPRLITGFGVYNRVVRTTQEGLVGGTCFDPWWGYYPCVGTATRTTNSVSQTKMGVNVGGALDFEASESVIMFVEVRYHHAFTSGQATQFIPINFGLRW